MTQHWVDEDEYRPPPVLTALAMGAVLWACIIATVWLIWP